jgi:hypothetical protein
VAGSHQKALEILHGLKVVHQPKRFALSSPQRQTCSNPKI